MELTPFAQMPATPDPVIAQIRQQLATAYRAKARLSDPELTMLAERTVRALWPSRVRTFVPILALREAQEALAAQGMLPQRSALAAPPHAAQTAPAAELQAQHDVLRLDRDVVDVDPDDRLQP